MKRHGLQKHVYDFFVDGEGRWFCEGNPVEDKKLFRQLSRSLFEDQGRFFIRCEGEIHPVRVADAPLWIRYVHLHRDERGQLSGIDIELNDGRREPLRPETLFVRDDSALYCRATRKNLLARFGKVAYYELAHQMTWDEGAKAYVLIVSDRRYDIEPDLS